jgi:hypothetical protein
MQRFFSAASQNRDRTKHRRPLRPRLCSAPLRKGHSASKTRVNALMALRCLRDTQVYFIRLNRTLLPSASRVAM